MKFARLLGLAVVLMLGVGAVSAVFAEEYEIRYVEVRKPFQNVYVKLDPKSEIIRQTKKGEYLELLSRGDSWYKVKVDGREGFLETRAGKVVNRKGAPIITFLLYLLVLGGCVFGVVLYVKKQQRIAASASADDSDSFPDDLDDDLD